MLVNVIRVKLFVMANYLQNSLRACETLMLDMDGTLLDLAYDSFIWLEVVPKEFAKKHRVSNDVAQKKIYQYFVDMQGTLDWYCLCLLYTSPSPRD